MKSSGELAVSSRCVSHSIYALFKFKRSKDDENVLMAVLVLLTCRGLVVKRYLCVFYCGFVCVCVKEKR